MRSNGPTNLLERLAAVGVRVALKGGRLRVRSRGPLGPDIEHWVKRHKVQLIDLLMECEHATQAASAETAHAESAPQNSEAASPATDDAARETSEREEEHGPQDAQHTAVARECEPTVTSEPQCDGFGESHSSSGTQTISNFSSTRGPESESADASKAGGRPRPEISIYSSRAPHPPIDPDKLTLKQAKQLGLYRVRRDAIEGQLVEIHHGTKWTHPSGDEVARDILAGRISREQAERMADFGRQQLDALRYARTRADRD